jgi:hypothetical protein
VKQTLAELTTRIKRVTAAGKPPAGTRFGGTTTAEDAYLRKCVSLGMSQRRAFRNKLNDANTKNQPAATTGEGREVRGVLMPRSVGSDSLVLVHTVRLAPLHSVAVTVMVALQAQTSLFPFLQMVARNQAGKLQTETT